MNVVCIGGEAAFKGRDGELVKLTGGEIRDSPEQIVPQPFRGIPCHSCRHAVCRDIADYGNDAAQNHDAAEGEDLSHISRWYHIVNDEGQKHGDEKVHDGSHKLDGKAYGHFQPEGFDIVENIFDGSQPPLFLNFFTNILIIPQDRGRCQCGMRESAMLFRFIELTK